MDTEEIPTVALSDHLDGNLLALWRDPATIVEIAVERGSVMHTRLNEDVNPLPPRLMHETRDDLLRNPKHAAKALNALQLEGTPESLEEAYKRSDKEKGGRSIFDVAEVHQDRNFEDAKPFRVRVAYRIVREHARLKNRIEEDESLVEALGINPNQPGDPWRQPSSFIAPQGRSRVDHITMPAWNALESLNGKPMLPPAVPNKFRDVGEGPGARGDMSILQSYAPEKDPDYLQWLQGCELIADYLKIDRGSLEDPEQGTVGMCGMFDPKTARLLWPSRYEICGFESMLVEETVHDMADLGIPQTITNLDHRYGLNKREATSIIKLAKAHAKEMMDAAIEDNRAIMQLRLESFIARSRSALNLGAEMHGLKLLALIQGIGKTSPEDENKDFFEVTAKVSKNRKEAKQILPGNSNNLDNLPTIGDDAAFIEARDARVTEE